MSDNLPRDRLSKLSDCHVPVIIRFAFALRLQSVEMEALKHLGERVKDGYRLLWNGNAAAGIT